MEVGLWISGFVSGIGFAVVVFTVTFLVVDTIAERRARHADQYLV